MTKSDVLQTSRGLISFILKIQLFALQRAAKVRHTCSLNFTFTKRFFGGCMRELTLHKNFGVYLLKEKITSSREAELSRLNTTHIYNKLII